MFSMVSILRNKGKSDEGPKRNDGRLTASLAFDLTCQQCSVDRDEWLMLTYPRLLGYSLQKSEQFVPVERSNKALIHLGRGPVVERTMGTLVVVVKPPGFDEHLRVCQTDEPMGVETFVPEATVEALDKCVLNRLARSGELQLNLMRGRPLVKHPADQIRPVIEHNRFRQPPFGDHLIENLDHPGTGQ